MTLLELIILDQLPSGFTYVSDDSGGSYNDNTGHWALGSLIDGATATLEIVATVNATGNYTNIAEVTSVDQNDPNGIVHGNQTPGEIDQAEITVTQTAITDLNVSKTVDNSTPNVGDIVTYTLSVINNGPSDATGVAIMDALPAGVTYSSHLANRWRC